MAPKTAAKKTPDVSNQRDVMAKDRDISYWIGVASSKHVDKGVKGGFAQLGHGKHIAVKALKAGDWLAYYSPRSELQAGEIVQAFTAIGRVISEEPYEVEENVWRIDIAYEQHALHADVHPLLAKLEFTQGLGSNWGVAFRTTKRKVSASDMQVIAKAMNVMA